MIRRYRPLPELMGLDHSHQVLVGLLRALEEAGVGVTLQPGLKMQDDGVVMTYRAVLSLPAQPP